MVNGLRHGLPERCMIFIARIRVIGRAFRERKHRSLAEDNAARAGRRRNLLFVVY